MSQEWIYTIVYLAWLAGAACFVLGLHRMNSPATARDGNRLSAAGMAVAVAATLVYLVTREGGLGVVPLIIIVVGLRHRWRRRPVHGADREDDRDAAAGVAVQRGRRRRGGPRRDRRLHPAQLGRPGRHDDLRRPRRAHRFGHLQRLADRRRQAPGAHRGQADLRPGRPDRDRGHRPRGAARDRGAHPGRGRQSFSLARSRCCW